MKLAWMAVVMCALAPLMPAQTKAVPKAAPKAVTKAAPKAKAKGPGTDLLKPETLLSLIHI